MVFVTLPSPVLTRRLCPTAMSESFAHTTQAYGKLRDNVATTWSWLDIFMAVRWLRWNIETAFFPARFFTGIAI